MIPVQRLLPGALTEVLRNAPLTPEKVAFAWRVAVGPALANATTVVLDAGVLRVHAQNDAWRREVERAAAMIRQRFEPLLGKDAVRYIHVTAGSERPRREGTRDSGHRPLPPKP